MNVRQMGYGSAAFMMLCAVLLLSDIHQAAHGSRPAFTASGPNGALSVMTYNVEGLPWPVRLGRMKSLAAIGARLAQLRASALQPRIVLLQEAFTDDAKRIAATAGYRYVADGPAAADRAETARRPDDIAFESQARAIKGERSGKWLGSGLRILSDYPILSIRREPFPGFACAGYDCLANKGMVMALVAVPGIAAPVAVVDTHLNSRHAAHVPVARSLYAYRAQIDALDSFLARNMPADSPLILGGDFNIGGDGERRAYMESRLARWIGDAGNAAFDRCSDDRNGCASTMSADARFSMARARDWQFTRVLPGGLAVKAISTPFGHEGDGTMLSDHVGYIVLYESPPAAA